MGSSSRTASTNSTTDNTFSVVDNRVTSDGGILGGNNTLSASDTQIGDLSITNTDYGAVSGGLNLALAALDSNTTGFAQTLDAIEETNSVANQTTLQAIDRSFALAGQASRSEAAGALEDFMRWSAVVLLGGGALYLIIKKFT